jgi:hypothetical protein
MVCIQTFVTCYVPITKIWFSFRPFKRLCGHFFSTRFLIVIQILFNHLCTLSHVQTLCNNLLDRALINIVPCWRYLLGITD